MSWQGDLISVGTVGALFSPRQAAQLVSILHDLPDDFTGTFGDCNGNDIFVTASGRKWFLYCLAAVARRAQ
jgi:hypothetical protein